MRFEELLLSAVLCAASASARPSSSVPLTALVDRADAIVVASSRNGLQSGTAISFDLSVIRVVKGAAAAGSVVRITWTADEPISGVQELPNRTGIWFLKWNPSGETSALGIQVPALDLEDIYYPVPGPPRTGAYAGAGGESQIEVVVLELAAAIDAFGDKAPRGINHALLTAGPDRCARTYKRLLNCPSAYVRALALAGLIPSNDPSVVVQIAKTLADLRKSPARGWIGVGLQSYFNTDPVGVAALGEIAATAEGSDFIAENAAFALVNIHTRDALPHLARLLDSPNPKVQSLAVSGISAFVQGLPVRKPADAISMAWLKPAEKSGYLTDEVRPYLGMGDLRSDRATETVRFWKAWWTSHQQELQSPKP